MKSVKFSNVVEIVEVGARDGLQIEKEILSTEKKIELINSMIDSGVKLIEATSFVSPKAVPQLADAEDVIDGISRSADTYLMALTPNKRAAQRAAHTSLDCGMFTCSASEAHNKKNLNRSIRESLDELPHVVHTLREAGKDVQGGMAVVFGCPFEGELRIDNVLRIARAYVDIGMDYLTLGDTTGMATPKNIRFVVSELQREFPGLRLSLHLHNTRGIAMANVMAGLEQGIRRFDSSSGGLGGCPFAAGATGNICTEDLLFLLEECGYETGIDLQKSIEVARLFESALKRTLPGHIMAAGARDTIHSVSTVEAAIGR